MIALTAAGLAYGYSLVQDDRFEASAELFFRQDQLSRSLFGTSDVPESRAPERVAATNLELASLELVAARVKRRLRSTLSIRELQERVSAKPRGEADIVSIVARAGSPARAQLLAQTFAEEVVAFRRQRAKREIQQAIDAVASQIEEGGVPAAVSRARRRRVEQLEVIKALESGDVEIVEPARLPRDPAAPDIRQNVIVGGVLGLIFGLAVVLLLDRLDRRIRDEDEIVELAGVPIIARVPKRPWGALPSEHDEIVHEALQFVRANPKLRAVGDGRVVTRGGGGARVVAVVSPDPRDGKTFITANLSNVLALSGERVVAVDCDLRRPDLHRILRVPLEEGVAEVLSDSAAPAEALTPAGAPGMRILTAGVNAPVAPPSALLGSERFVELVSALREEADFILLDTPPIRVAADASEVAGAADVTLMVVDARRARRDAIGLAAEQLRQAGANVLGVIVNRAKVTPSSYYQYRAPQAQRPGPVAPREPEEQEAAAGESA